MTVYIVTAAARRVISTLNVNIESQLLLHRKKILAVMIILFMMMMMMMMMFVTANNSSPIEMMITKQISVKVNLEFTFLNRPLRCNSVVYCIITVRLTYRIAVVLHFVNVVRLLITLAFQFVITLMPS